MFRRGELISTPGTTDKVPTLDFQYTPTDTFPTLAESTGGMSRFIAPGPGSIAKNGICNMCHNEARGYTRAYSDIYPPEISFVYGVAGSNELVVVFSEPVYSNGDTTGDLVPADFVLTDTDDSRTIASVTHTAGTATATVALSAPLDASDDVGTDTLAAASMASIYDASGNPMATAQVTILGDAAAPVLVGQDPENGAVDVSLNKSLNFLLLDDSSGIDVSTLSIQLSGNLGYSKSYTLADSGVVSGKGTPGSYKVTIKPDAFFAEGEVITVTINVDDLAGNSLVPPAWTFTAAVGAIWLSPDSVRDSFQLSGANYLIDGNLVTGNVFSPGGPNHYATFQLDAGGDLYDVTDVRFYGGPDLYRSWRVYVSRDGLSFYLLDTFSVGGASQWYEFALPSTQTARYIRIDAFHGGPESADVLFEFEFKGTAVVNDNNAPTLAWTGEANYTNDGANPESALGGSDFEFRVSYADADNQAPALIQLWLDKDGNSSYATTEKFDLTLASGGDGDYTNGEIFATTLTLAYAGVSNMSYRFVASDDVDAATGDPTSDLGVVVTNNIPTLSWTGETGYTGDGVNPDSGSEGVSIDFRVKYTDLDDQFPNTIQVWIDEDQSGTYEEIEKYDLIEVNAADTIFTDGKLYSYATTLSLVGDGVLSYRFYATDGTDDATGAPVSDKTVTVTANAPVLAWTGETNYTNDGANPDSGAGGNNFEFRVSYSDADNEAPASIQLWIDEDDSSTYEAGEKYDLTAVDGSDTDYTSGKLYSKTLALVYAGDGGINYRFYASDGALEDAASDPVTGSQITVTADTNTIPTLAWTGETDYAGDGVNPDADLSGSSFEFRVSYADANNDAPSVIQLWIDENENGAYDVSEKHDLTAVDGGDTDYTDGKLYSVVIPVSGVEGRTLNYRFRAFDGSADASGLPVTGNTLLIADPLEVPAEYDGIQAAIDVALEGDFVVVSDGTYYENISFNGKAITVQSLNGAAVTTIDANNAGGPVVTFNSGETADAVLDGFTLINGIGVSGRGGGIYISGSSPTVKNSVITGNAISSNGGGIYIISSSMPTVTGVTVSGNSAQYGGGIIVGTSSFLTLADSIVSNNETTWRYGGGIYIGSATAVINNTEITGNTVGSQHGGGVYVTGAGASTTINNSNVSNNTAGYGGGVFVKDSATVTINDSSINDNTTSLDGGGLYSGTATVNVNRTVISGNKGRYGGGALFGDTAATFVNATITGNKSTRGGGIHLNTAGANLTMINSTIGGNYASSYGGGLFANGTVTLTNTIIWGNASLNENEIWNTVDSANVTNSDIDKAGYDGINGSIRLDPLFVSPIADPATETPTTTGDYHLQSGSPAIDAGTATGAPADDIDGDTRPVDGPDGDSDAEYDIGSDEYVP
jgi:parallel beta-helix repeat protein